MFNLLISSAFAADENDIPTPLPFDNIESLIWTIVNYLLYIAGIVAVVFIILGGYQYMSSQGNEEASKKAQKTITYAVIGLVIVLAAYAIKTTIVQRLGINI